MAESWWDRLWLNQLWKLHLHHVGSKQMLRHRVRQLESALAWAQQSAAEQTEKRLQAEQREDAAARMVAEMGLDTLHRWLTSEDTES
jgi:hypothetical protein